ncbi:MAG: hypothetical protein FWD57_12330 [Polyangiaceae bacterium]|nr:hypothetical protein [Polyangiaceae bacterium]
MEDRAQLAAPLVMRRRGFGYHGSNECGGRVCTWSAWNSIPAVMVEAGANQIGGAAPFDGVAQLSGDVGAFLCERGDDGVSGGLHSALLGGLVAWLLDGLLA